MKLPQIDDATRFEMNKENVRATFRQAFVIYYNKLEHLGIMTPERQEYMSSVYDFVDTILKEYTFGETQE